MVKRTPIQTAISGFKANTPADPGKSAVDRLASEQAGDENDKRSEYAAPDAAAFQCTSPFFEKRSGEFHRNRRKERVCDA